MVVTRSQRKTNVEPSSGTTTGTTTGTSTGTTTSDMNSSTTHTNIDDINITSTSKALQLQEQSNSAEQENETKTPKTPLVTMGSFALIALISYFTYPDTLQPVGRPTLNHVWYFGWISALSTGLGVLPLIFSPKLDSYWIGVTNGKTRLTD